MNKKKKKHGKIVFWGKNKLNNVEVILISNAFFSSYISHNEFFSVNIVLREYNEIKNFVWYIKALITYYVSCKKNTANENSSVRKTLNKID